MGTEWHVLIEGGRGGDGDDTECAQEISVLPLGFPVERDGGDERMQ